MSLAEQAWRNSDPALATIYVLNALNHNPANMNCLQFYYNILENKRGLEISDIDQFIDILDVSVYQVSPGDVSKVLTMRNTLLSKQESMLNSAAAEVNRDAATQFAATQRALSNGRLSPSEINRSGKVNMELLDERIETIATLISDADMSDSDRSSYMKLLNESTTFKMLATTLESAENAISKAYSLANRSALTAEQILLARNQLQTANTYLSQIWTIDTTNFQAQLNAAENLQARIATIDKRLDVLASAPARTKIESKLAECRNLYGSYTSRINKISTTLKEAAPLLAEVPDLDTRKYLESAMEEAAQQVENLTKSRYKAYQEWAAGQINAAIKEYNSYTVVTDGRATNMFNTYLLSINTGLLLRICQLSTMTFIRRFTRSSLIKPKTSTKKQLTAISSSWRISNAQNTFPLGDFRLSAFFLGASPGKKWYGIGHQRQGRRRNCQLYFNSFESIIRSRTFQHCRRNRRERNDRRKRCIEGLS